MNKVNKDEIASFEFTLDRIEGESAVLLDSEDEKVELPASLLPKNITDGEALVVTIATEKAETRRREQKAKDILNEILNSGMDSE